VRRRGTRNGATSQSLSLSCSTAIESAGGVEEVLKKSVTQFESQEPQPWRYDLPDEFQAGLVRAIVGFEEGVLAGLASRGDEMSLKVREMMLKTGERP
jgi:hypothetical protein